MFHIYELKFMDMKTYSRSMELSRLTSQFTESRFCFTLRHHRRSARYLIDRPAGEEGRRLRRAPFEERVSTIPGECRGIRRMT